MIHTSLVPLDGSMSGYHALPFARAVARTFGGRLVLLRALPPGPGRSQPAEPELAEIERLVRELGKEGIDAEAQTRTGSPVAVIREAATACHADLIVMASHQRHGLDRWFHGSVSEAVIQGTRVPVLIVPFEGAPVPPRVSPLRMLVPLDGSVFAEVALEVIRQVAATRPVQVLLTQVVHLRILAAGGVTPYAVDPEAEIQYDARHLEQLAEQLRADGIPTTVQVIQSLDPTADVILGLADEEKTSIIVMATHGRGALAHLALGSVSTAVLEHSPIPVMLVPGRQADGPARHAGHS